MNLPTTALLAAASFLTGATLLDGQRATIAEPETKNVSAATIELTRRGIRPRELAAPQHELPGAAVNSDRRGNRPAWTSALKPSDPADEAPRRGLRASDRG